MDLSISTEFAFKEIRENDPVVVGSYGFLIKLSIEIKIFEPDSTFEENIEVIVT